MSFLRLDELKKKNRDLILVAYWQKLMVLSLYLFNSSEWPKWTHWLPLHLRVHLPLFTILISHDQLPSGLVAQLVEQR